MSLLNENHKRNLVSTFQEIDRILTQAVEQLEERECPSPLQAVIPDADGVLISIAENWLEDTRATMRSILEENSIPLPQPDVSAVWNLRVSMVQATNYADNLRPQQMKQYGPLAPTSAAALEAISRRLRTQMESMLQLLDASHVSDRDGR